MGGNGQDCGVSYPVSYPQRVTAEEVALTIGYLKATVVHIRVTLGHFMVTYGSPYGNYRSP